MTIDSNFRIPFQNFATNAAKKLGLTAEQLRTLLEPDMQKISVFFQTQAKDIKQILDNPHINADGFEAEYLRLQKEMNRFVDFIHQDVQQRLEDQHLDSTQVGKFVDSLMDEAKSLTGSSRLIDQLSSRGKSSIFYLASQKRALSETIFPPHPIPEPILSPSAPSNPDLLPYQGPCDTINDLYIKYTHIITDDPYKLSDGAKNLLRTFLQAIDSAVVAGRIHFGDPVINVGGVLRDAAPESDDVFWRYKGLTQVEYYFINNCTAVADRYGQETYQLPGYLANDFERKIADLIGLIKQGPENNFYNDFLAYMEQDPDFTPDAPNSFIQEKARLFSMTPEFAAASPEAKAKLETFAGITNSPVTNYFEYMKSQLPNSDALFDMMIQDAKAKGLTTMSWPNEYLNFMNQSLNAIHSGVDVYLYTGITPEDLLDLKQVIPGLDVPDKAFTTYIYENLNNLLPDIKLTQLYTDLINKFAAICQDDSISQNDKAIALTAYLQNLFLTNDPKLTSLPLSAQSEIFEAVGASFPHMYLDLFQPILQTNKNFQNFVQDFTSQLGTDPMTPGNFRTALANFITNKIGKSDIYMTYPTISQDDLQKMVDEVFPNWKLPIPKMTTTDHQYQQTYSRVLHHTTPGSDDETVYNTVLAAIQREGSEGNAEKIQNWVNSYLEKGTNGYNPTELTVSWLKGFF